MTFNAGVMSSMGYIRGFKNDGGYELVLQKNVDTGEWTKPNSAQTEPSVIKTYEVTNSEFAEEYFENDKLVTMVRYYGMSVGNWKADDYTYQYRLEITGRMKSVNEIYGGLV